MILTLQNNKHAQTSKILLAGAKDAQEATQGLEKEARNKGCINTWVSHPSLYIRIILHQATFLTWSMIGMIVKQQ